MLAACSEEIQSAQTLIELNYQNYLYGGKELDRKFGINAYDFTGRYYDLTDNRFWSMDPMAEKYYSISPYAYCGNNPLNRIDPTGMIWDDPEMAKEYEGQINEKISWLNGQISARLSWIQSGKISLEDVSKYSKEIIDSRDRVEFLNKSLDDFNTLAQDDNHKYAFNETILDDEANVTKESNKIFINASNTTGVIHEIHHIVQSLKTGKLVFEKNNLQNPGNTYIERGKNEVIAYQYGFSFNRSYPGYTFENPYDIQLFHISVLKDSRGNLMYPYLKKKIPLPNFIPIR